MAEVTAIIPTYRRPQETARCLRHLAESTVLREEFSLRAIVVDSSPDDCTWQAIRQFSDPLGLQYIRLAEQTMPGDARNLAVQEARGELVLSLDSDVYIAPRAAWSLISYLREHPRVARVTGVSVFCSGPKTGQVDRPKPVDRMHEDAGTTFCEGIFGRYEAFYRSAFLEVGGYDPLFVPRGEGADLSIRYWRAGLPLGFDAGALGYHDIDAPYGLTRDRNGVISEAYRFLSLLAYKYDLQGPDASPGFVATCENRVGSYSPVPFHAVASAAEFAEWLTDHLEQLLDSRRRVPRTFGFTPFDVFTDRGLLTCCLAGAQERIRPFHRAAFGVAAQGCTAGPESSHADAVAAGRREGYRCSGT